MQSDYIKIILGYVNNLRKILTRTGFNTKYFSLCMFNSECHQVIFIRKVFFVIYHLRGNSYSRRIGLN